MNSFLKTKIFPLATAVVCVFAAPALLKDQNTARADQLIEVAALHPDRPAFGSGPPPVVKPKGGAAELVYGHPLACRFPARLFDRESVGFADASEQARLDALMGSYRWMTVSAEELGVRFSFYANFQRKEVTKYVVVYPARTVRLKNSYPTPGYNGFNVSPLDTNRAAWNCQS